MYVKEFVGSADLVGEHVRDAAGIACAILLLMVQEKPVETKCIQNHYCWIMLRKYQCVKLFRVFAWRVSRVLSDRGRILVEMEQTTTVTMDAFMEGRKVCSVSKVNVCTTPSIRVL